MKDGQKESRAKAALFLGDSICAGYFPFVYDILESKGINAERRSVGDSSQLLGTLEGGFSPDGFDLIHFNCGLHDLRVDKKTGLKQQSLEIYEKNLKEAIGILGIFGNVQLLFLESTPVIESRHNAENMKEQYRYMEDIDAYNNLALSMMKRNGIPSYSLSDAINGFGIERIICGDGVHMTEAGKEFVSTFIADKVSSFFPSSLNAN